MQYNNNENNDEPTFKEKLCIGAVGVIVAFAIFYGYSGFSFSSILKELGNHIYSPDGTVYVGADNNKITLINNESAKDVTFNEVMSFINQDKTDKIEYNMNSFTCGDYAEQVQNNAENAGIKCAWVGIDFTQGGGHACNAFNTTDKGLIFIDCTTGDYIIKNMAIGNIYQPVQITKDNSIIEPMGTIQDYDIHWE